MQKSIWICLLVLILIPACETPPYSLQPIYTDETIFEDSLLTGTWLPEDSDVEDGLVKIWREGDYGFHFTVDAEDDFVIQGAGYSLRLGGRTFLNLLPTAEIARLDTVPLPILPSHLVLRYEVRNDSLFAYFIPDTDWASHLESRGVPFLWQESGDDPDGLLETDDMLILLQETKELQALFIEVWDAKSDKEEEMVVASRLK